MLDFLLLPTSRTYWYDYVQVPNSRTPSFLNSPPNTSTLACVSLGFNGSNWIDHQGIDNIFSLKTLNLCKEKLLTDLTRDLHKPQIWATKSLESYWVENPKI